MSGVQIPVMQRNTDIVKIAKRDDNEIPTIELRLRWKAVSTIHHGGGLWVTLPQSPENLLSMYNSRVLDYGVQTYFGWNAYTPNKTRKLLPKPGVQYRWPPCDQLLFLSTLKTTLMRRSTVPSLPFIWCFPIKTLPDISSSVCVFVCECVNHLTFHSRGLLAWSL